MASETRDADHVAAQMGNTARAWERCWYCAAAMETLAQAARGVCDRCSAWGLLSPRDLPHITAEEARDNLERLVLLMLSREGMPGSEGTP